MDSVSISVHKLQLRYEHGKGMLLVDRSSEQTWIWPSSTLGVVQVDPTGDSLTPPVNHFNGQDPVELVAAGQWSITAVIADGSGMRVEVTGSQGRLVQLWELEPIGVNVRTEIVEWTEKQQAARVISPGIVRSVSGTASAVLPIYQGLLHKKGEYAALIKPGSHGRHQQGITGLLGSAGGLAAIVDLNWDYEIYIRARENLQDAVAYVPLRTFGKYAASYTTRYRICRSSVFDVAQTYRDHKIAQGQFRTWEEKLETTPGLEDMFGAPHFFIGYFNSSHDYLGAMNAAKDMGFDRAFVYPTVFRSFNPEMPLKDGAHWIDISRLHEGIKNLGYHIASWSWPEEAAIQPGAERGLWSILGLDEQGRYSGGWATGDYQWYTVAGAAQVQFMHWVQQNMWPELTAQHFDVTGNKVFAHRFGNKLYDRAADVECRRAVFEQAARVGPVSTEGFCDGFQQAIHCGSVMAYPSWGDRDWWTVPLNSIVYHDSAMNVWWEADSYNNPHHQQQHHRDRHAAPAGGGKALQQSLWDALQGTPPNVFLCGKMYRPADGVDFAKGYDFYEIHFNEESTRQALKLAKPVADLHRKVGKEQMTGYEILTSDGRVQRTTFKDGTTVTVNFGKESWKDGVTVYKPESWSAV
jgi:hypothetical protein